MDKDRALSSLTDCGLSGIGMIPYGAHFCHFYSNRQDLIDSMVSYFKAGLQNNERCLWITADPLPDKEARAEIEHVMPGISVAIKEGHIRIFDAGEVIATTQGPGGKGQLGYWLAEEEKALTEGYQGLRIAGNTSFVSPQEWDAFMAYEKAANKEFEARRIVALCSYKVVQCQATDVFEVIRNHQFTLNRREKDWEVLEKRFVSKKRPPVKASVPAAPTPLVRTARRHDSHLQ